MVSATTIAATVPAGATSGYVTVRTPAGLATSLQRFTVGSEDDDDDDEEDDEAGRLSAQPPQEVLSVLYFPNSFTQSFVLKVSGKPAGTLPFRVYNAYGKVVLRGDDLQSEQTITLGTGLMPGVYTLEVDTGGKARRFKVVKAHGY